MAGPHSLRSSPPSPFVPLEVGWGRGGFSYNTSLEGLV